MNIEQLTQHTGSDPTAVSVYQRVETLVMQAARDGQLSREEELMIVTAITHSGQPTAEVCRLFRQLQEQVWDGELLLDRAPR